MVILILGSDGRDGEPTCSYKKEVLEALKGKGFGVAKDLETAIKMQDDVVFAAGPDDLDALAGCGKEDISLCILLLKSEEYNGSAAHFLGMDPEGQTGGTDKEISAGSVSEIANGCFGMPCMGLTYGIDEALAGGETKEAGISHIVNALRRLVNRQKRLRMILTQVLEDENGAFNKIKGKAMPDGQPTLHVGESEEGAGDSLDIPLDEYIIHMLSDKKADMPFVIYEWLSLDGIRIG